MSRKPATSTTTAPRIQARSPLQNLRRIAVPFLAFVITAVGIFLLTANGAPTEEADVDGIATVVLASPLPAGATTADVIAASEVRLLPSTARAEGALSELDALPTGVLAADMVPGQQVLFTSIADDVVDALGEGLVAVSVRLDPQRWAGPLKTTGDTVTVHDVVDDGTTVIAQGVRIVSAPDPSELDPRSEQVITLAVLEDSATDVITAAADNRLWLVGS